MRAYGLSGGESDDKIADISPTTMQKQVSEFFATRFCVLRHMRDPITDINDIRKDQSVLKAKYLSILILLENRSY